MRSVIDWIPITERVPTKQEVLGPSGYARCLVIAHEWHGPCVMLADVYDYGEERPERDADRIDWMFSVPGWLKMNVSHWAYLPDVSKASEQQP